MPASKWIVYGLEEKIIEILKAVKYKKKHHFGNPFVTPYQIAIIFKDIYSSEFQSIGLPIGGKKTGNKNTL